MPKGGIRMAETTLKEDGYEPDPAVHEIFTKYVTTVNDGIFRAYTSNIRRARHAHTVTGLPDAYSRGRIIGVYTSCSLRCRLLDAGKSKRLECNRRNR